MIRRSVFRLSLSSLVCAGAALGLTACTGDAPEQTAGRRASSESFSASGSVRGGDRDDDARPGAYQEPPAPPAASTMRRPALCDRDDADAVRDVFCVDAPPAVTSLRVLQDLLKVNSATLAADPSYDPNGIPPTTADDTLVDTAVFLSHSTALSGHLVSPLNPRAIFLGEQTILTFQRGLQQIEFATMSRDRGAFNFYLLTFKQACTRQPGGCKPGDLYTPRVEVDWTDVVLRDDEELKNTTADCRQCHTRGREYPALLMRELQAPWTHFFEPDTPLEDGVVLPGVRGADLVRDYLRAKGNEPYAGMSTNTIRHTVGLFLQNVVDVQQPLLFPAPIIEDERWPFENGAYASTPRPSPTWERAYEAFKRGEQLALPHYDPRPTDPVKQARLTEAYIAYRKGTLPADELPDLADIFPDDPMTRARIGLQVEPGATAPEILVQACGSCHNDVLDQTISRARFNIDLQRMPRAELDAAIARIQLPPTHPSAMPPREARQLDDEGRARLVEYLRANVRTAEDDALLSHAAEVGMTGGGRR